MGNRLDLHNILLSIINNENVYFQPPPTILLSYPCIVYRRSKIRTRHADNNPFSLIKQYTITVIDRNPDSVIPDKIALLSSCTFDRHYTADNLNHDVFTLFF